jgi:hypothetical protein
VVVQDGLTVFREGLEVRGGKPLDVAVHWPWSEGAALGAIEGRVARGSGAKGRSVVLALGDGILLQAEVTGSAFSLQGVPAGDWKLVPVVVGRPLAPEDVERATSVHVEANKTTHSPELRSAP